MSALDSIIVAQGTASQVSQSLGLEFNVYSNGTESYYSASGVSALEGVYLYSSNVTSVLLAHPTSLVTESTITALRSSTSSQSNQTAPVESYPVTDIASAYNASSLYGRGITGKGYTIGLLDFDGDAYIAQQLQYFDEVYGVPSSSLHVIPIGPYDPGLGAVTGWDGEISLDVESAHAMAPGAAIDLYIGNGALPISAAVAQIVQDDKVNDLSQSFGIGESMVSQMGASALDLNVILADQYYMLGSAEGITFTASTGDRAGTGASGGPEGTGEYPSTSPYVVAVGGTTTFLDFEGSQVVSSYQTAWSNYGFVPDGANYGGETSGISILEPRPWYQSGLSAPSGFAYGRVVPDVSLEASVYPGVEIIFPGNGTEITGGTSVASPLLAGLLALLMQSSKGSLGLINPRLYSLGQSSALNSKVYTPITFGYNIPWVASSGFSMLTGWGAPNIGEMASVGLGAASGSFLGINVSVSAGKLTPFEYASGQSLQIGALVTRGSSAVQTGSFTAELDTLQGPLASTTLSFSSSVGDWAGTITVPSNAAGLAFLTVKGSSNGVSGTGFAELFAGYVATYLSPTTALDLSPLPYSAAFGIPLALNITTLTGQRVTTGTFTVTFSTYSITSNTYSPFVGVPLSYAGGQFGEVWTGTASGSYPNGPMIISTNDGAYGYLPFIEGSNLENTFVETTVLAEPGVVAPGQTVYIVATVQPPLNLPYVISPDTGATVAYEVELGSNLTATMVSSSGTVVVTSHIFTNSFLTTSLAIQGYFDIPQGLKPGLYTILLNSNFDSYTLGASVDGSYFAQVYVASSASVPRTSITPSLLFEGQSATVSTKIEYANGTSVRYGMYMATVYPTDLQNVYNALTLTIQVPLFYDVSTGLWSGNITLPSAYNGGGTISIDPGAIYLNGPYDVFVTGLSADGVPATTDISSQLAFQIQPYLLISDQGVSSVPQTSGVAFQNDVITASVNLADDLFTGSNTIQGGSVTIFDSQINGTLDVNDAQVTLVGVTGGTIVAQNSKIVLDQSSVSSLQLTGSQLSLNDSSFDRISPSLPTITVQSPAANQIFDGNSGSLSVNGQDVSSISVYLDGSLLTTLTGGASSYSFSLASSSLQDGVHLLRVVANQQDGLSASDSVYFTTNGQLTAADNEISTLTTQIGSATASISSLGSQLNSANGTIGGFNSKLNAANTTIGSLNSKVDADHTTITSLMDGFYALAVIAVIGLVVAVVALARRSGGSPQPISPSTSGTESPSPPTGGTEAPTASGREDQPQPSSQPQ
jgi:subtilase family serine protease